MKEHGKDVIGRETTLGDDIMRHVGHEGSIPHHFFDGEKIPNATRHHPGGRAKY